MTDALLVTPTMPTARSARLEDLRSRNTSAILRALLHTGAVARTDLATELGMSTGTATKITAALIRAGLVRELPGQLSAGLGRPKVPVAIDESRYAVIGVHFGYRRMVTSLLSLTGRLIHEVQHTHSETAFESLARHGIEAIRTMSDEQDRQVLGVGASTGGWVDASTGIVREHAALGWHDAPLASVLAEGTGFPVVVDSHFQALAAAEHWLGSAVGVDNLVHLFVGNVVGAGFILNGHPYRGANGTAGMVDHLPVTGVSGTPCECGRTDCLRMVAGDIEILRRARATDLVSEDADIFDVIELAAAGNPIAGSLMKDRSAAIGSAVARLIELFDPEMVVIGGGVASPPAYLERVLEITRAAARDSSDTDRFGDVGARIRASSFVPHAVAVAAGALLLSEFYRAPERFVPAVMSRDAFDPSALP